MGLFSKLKDYNLELEEILDKKYFSSNIKNLLLSMIYKLEISYVDFKEVKRCVRSKEDFLNEIIETIRLYCDNVKTVEPDSSQSKMLVSHKVRALTNEKERSILTYPTEIALLYAISDISPKYFYIDQEFVLKDKLQVMLVNGYNYNNLEILKDFTGWSWDRSYDERFGYLDNLIYQNFLVLFGEKFLYEWRTYGSTRRDFLEEAKENLNNSVGNDKYFTMLYRVLYLSSKDKDKINTKLNEYSKILKKMDDKNKYFDDLKSKKEKMIKKIKKISITLDDVKLLEKSFISYNSKIEPVKQIKSFKKYTKLLEVEREKLIKEVAEIDKLLVPTNYFSYKYKLKQNCELYNYKGEGQKDLIELQKEFLKILYKRACKLEKKEELLDVIYEIRYYRKMRISKDLIIDDIEELEEAVDKVLKQVISSLSRLNGMKIISRNNELNYEIIKYAIDNKIIKLSELRLAFDYDEAGLIIKIFDKEIFEKQGRKEIKVEKDTLEVKKGRKVKLFN